MIIAALLAFAALVASWLLAPAEPRTVADAPMRSGDAGELLGEAVPKAA
jgi:hypothetical protein